MMSPDEKETVEGVIANVQVMRKLGIVREYDLIFTDRGILFAIVAGALKVGAREGLPAGLGAGMVAGIGLGLLAKIPHTNEKTRQKYAGLTLKQILEHDKMNFYLPLLSIDSVTVKKKLMGMGGMNFVTTEGKIQCEFSKDILDSVREIVSIRLTSKLS